MVDHGCLILIDMINGLYGVSIVMGIPKKMDGLVQGKSHLEMDDDVGVPL